MATIRWEVPLTDYFDVAGWIAEADSLSASGGPADKLAELVERIQRYPGYPHSRTPDDTVVVTVKDARVWITPDPTGKEPR